MIKETIIILMCYLHQPVALYLQSLPDKVFIQPFNTIALEDDTKETFIKLCKSEEPVVPENLIIWHLDKINHHILIEGKNGTGQ